MQDSTFYINSEDIGISKLVSQLKYSQVYLNIKMMTQLLRATLFKKMQDKESRSTLISEAGKIVRLLLL